MDGQLSGRQAGAAVRNIKSRDSKTESNRAKSTFNVIDGRQKHHTCEPDLQVEKVEIAQSLEQEAAINEYGDDADPAKHHRHLRQSTAVPEDSEYIGLQCGHARRSGLG